MNKQKTIIITFSKQTIEIPTITQDDQMLTYDNLYNTIKNEFNIEFKFDIFTSETNTLLNQTNLSSIILDLTDDFLELYLIEQNQLQQKSKKIPNPNYLSKKNSETTNFISNESNIFIKNQNIEGMTTISICSICSNKINKVKYECAICEDCTLCEDCELKHEHPVIRFKTKFLSSSRQEIFHLLQITDKEKFTKKSTKSMSYISLSSNLINNEITLAPQITKTFYINIKNKSGINIPKESFILVAKDYYDLKLNFENEIQKDILNKDEYKVPINIKAESKEGIYEIYFFCRTSVENKNFYKFNSVPIKIKVNVVNDEEEQKMSLFFGEYQDIQILPTNKMKIIYNIINDGLSSKSPLEIYSTLREAKWNIQKSIEKLI